VVGEEWNPQILVNMPVTNVPRCVSRNVKTLGLKHLQLPEVPAGRGPPDLTCVIHHRTNELLVEQHTVSDGQAASPVTEGAKHAQSLICLVSHFFDVRRPGKLSIKGDPTVLALRETALLWVFGCVSRP
jgi:hypothetical protein